MTASVDLLADDDAAEGPHEIVNRTDGPLLVWAGQSHVAVLKPGEAALFSRKLSGWRKEPVEESV